MMPESGRYALNAQLDSDQILLQAKHRWLRPAEICEILQNHKKFQIAPTPPNRPPSGSLFLFDRKVLRHFRRDGHNWRKNKDGRTMKEAHERLKSGGVDVLHCYYSYGEDNENFQRRSYWMLEEELSHIALVHYMEVKGNRANFNRVRGADGIPASQQNEEDISNTKVDSSEPEPATTKSCILQNRDRRFSTAAYRHQASPGFQSIHELQMPAMQNMDVGSIPHHPVPISNNYQGQSSAIPAMSFGLIRQGEESKNPMDNGMTYILQRDIELPSWKNLVESSSGYMSFNFELSLPSTQSSPMRLMPRQDNELLDQVEASDSKGLHDTYLTDQSRQPMENDLQVEALNTVGSSLNSEPDGNLNVGGVMREGLKSPDSLDRWISKELGDVTESTKQPGSGAYLETAGSEHGDDSDFFTQVPLDNYILGPSLSQDQLFSIIDISPNWAYSRSKVKVLIMGKFLRSQEEVENYKWACMFGELEVSSQIVRDGVLCCYTPSHGPGRVPFYITCSNRLACSEVREFEFRASPVEDVESDETLLRMRFGKLLSLGSGSPPISVLSVESETSQLCSKISALLKDDTEWEQMLSLSKQDQFSADKVTDQLLQKLLKEKLHNWLLQKIVEGGKGPNVLDEDGQGVLHLAAALGYDWAIPPTVAAGVCVNFRDANGWTALHWAAYCGRERTVWFLISLGAAPGALTNLTPKHPSRGTPSDLAVKNGHKGIAGYLAESALRSNLIQLDLEDSKESDIREKVVETVTIPTHFRCPISLDLMRDPVLLMTGITYDRESINKWIDTGNVTCPVTNHVLRNFDQIRNHALRKMIQDWCVENKSYGVERIPTPRIPITPYEVSEVCSRMAEATRVGDENKCQELVRNIKNSGKESERNRRCIVNNGIGSTLADMFESFAHFSVEKHVNLLKEILSSLTWSFPLGEEGVSKLTSSVSLRCMAWFLKGQDLSSRQNTIFVLKELIISGDQGCVDGLMEVEGIEETLFHIVKVPICPKATQASLLIIHHMMLSSQEKSRIITLRFVQMGLIPLILDILVDGNRSISEKVLGILDSICKLEEGKKRPCKNALVIPLVVKKILRVSITATEFSISILWKLSLGENENALIEALQLGAFQKLLVVLQVGCGETTKKKVTELLRLMHVYRDKVDCFDSSMRFKRVKKPN